MCLVELGVKGVAFGVACLGQCFSPQGSSSSHRRTRNIAAVQPPCFSDSLEEDHAWKFGA